MIQETWIATLDVLPHQRRSERRSRRNDCSTSWARPEPLHPAQVQVPAMRNQCVRSRQVRRLGGTGQMQQVICTRRLLHDALIFSSS